jgi:hypothetical protein
MVKNTKNKKKEIYMAPKKEKVYHCDGYYERSVCMRRGMQDAGDDRNRWVCKSNGVAPFDGIDMCPHCSEYKRKIRHVKTHNYCPAQTLTPWHAMNQQDLLVRAFQTKAELQLFLAWNEVYGENCMDGSPVIEREVITGERLAACKANNRYISAEEFNEIRKGN